MNKQYKKLITCIFISISFHIQTDQNQHKIFEQNNQHEATSYQLPEIHAQKKVTPHHQQKTAEHFIFLDQKLIEKFIKAVNEIPEKYKLPKNFKPEKLPLKNPQSYRPENPEYRKKVKEAEQLYKNLYHTAQGKHTTKDDNQKIKKATEKLFKYTNIQNKPWLRK